MHPAPVCARHPRGATLTVEAKGGTHSPRIPDPSGRPETFPAADATADEFGMRVRPVENGRERSWLAKLLALRDAGSVRNLLQ